MRVRAECHTTVDARTMPQDPPPKPFGTPRPLGEPRTSGMPEGDREMILTRLAEVDQRWSAKFDGFASATDKRLTALEKAALLERETALAVRELTASVNVLNARDRAQDLDINTLGRRIEAATRPAVQATASAAGSAEGTIAGADAGKRTARFWGIVVAVLGIIANQLLTQCEQSIANYRSGTATPASSTK